MTLPTVLQRALGAAAIVFALLPAGATAADEWKKYEDCRLLDHPSNDGDSFHVKHKTGLSTVHRIYRLYFVDCPESEDSIPERLAEQADYFKVDPRDILKLGKEAGRLTRDLLKNGFTIYTKLEDARGRSDMERYFAVIMVGKVSLADVLVQNGLARIYGAKTDLPDGKRWEKYEADLRVKEREAQRDRRGAWGGNKAAAPGRPRTVEEQDVVIARATSVYTPGPSPRLLAVLPSGTTVRVLRQETPFMLRIRYMTPEGQPIEALCQRTQIGL